ncbi:hypothetical protein EV643_108283 [Kribbella sp. VKM Ac-2527]|uniref:F0F1-type ATP synthase membrane subunit b/b n=1 Tax=Kribbella caucasensis TaxID=2512215 RepID=A0A4R6KDT9_9ACTN|nr:hypothetical protein [Kribbella sp. VKM Ac-2527]TDO47966.1 hypothetical protein EV643_108283 [Kribbella sp. VKM Ac-2527]
MTHTTNHRVDAESPPAEGVTEAAREEAGQLNETSVEATRQVAGTVKEKASDVTLDAREQARRLASQTREELVGQAGQQEERATNGLRSVSDELRGMAEHGESGLGAQLARQGADFTDQAADFLQKHEPGDLLEEVRGFARRKPGTFLLAAVAAGVVAGRLTRSLAAGGTGTPSNTGSPSGVGMPEQSVGGAAADDYLVAPPPAPVNAPPVAPTSAPPPAPTPVAPDPDPGAPVTPRIGPGSNEALR